MKKIWKKLRLNKYIALILTIVLMFSSVTSVRALDFTHSNENRHYLVYNDINALAERIVNAYETSNYAVLGENIYLPLVDGNEISEGEDYLIDILANLAGKYLVDTVTVMDDLTVYLTADIDTLEFYLLVANNTEQEHFVTLVFGDGMEFDPVSINYSFTLVDKELENEVEEELEGEVGEELEGEVEEELEGEVGEELEGKDDEETTVDDETTGGFEDIEGGEVDSGGIIDGNIEIQEDDQSTQSPSNGEENGNKDKDISKEDDQEIVIDPIDKNKPVTNSVSNNGNISEHQATNSSGVINPSHNGTESDVMNEDNNDASEEVFDQDNSEANEDVNDEANEETSEETDEEANEETNEESNEEMNEETSEETDEEANEESSEESNEEENELENEESSEEGAEEGTGEELEKPALGKVLIGMLLGEMVLSKNSVSLQVAPSSAASVEFRYNSSDYLPTISKTSTDNGDGTYTITLTVKGNNEIITKKTPINLVLALDVSNSMYWAMSDKTLSVNFDGVTREPKHYRHNDPSVQSRWRVLQNSITEIIDKILTVEGSQISIVMFSGDNHTTNRNWSNLNYSVLSDWSSSASTIKSTYLDKELWELTNGPGGRFNENGGNGEGAGGTNGAAGFHASGLQFGKNSNANPNYLIYISDGIANRYLESNQGNLRVSTSVNDATTNTEEWFQQIALKTISFAQKVKSDYNAKIYTIGISGALDTTIGKRIGSYLMNPSTNKYQENYYTAATAGQLSDALTEINNSISGKKLTNLVVKDQLSKYVTYEGNLVYDGNSASIDENGLLTWDVANELSKSESRQLSYKVKVNNITAYQDENKLIPKENYVSTDNSLIGYYENEKKDEDYYFHSNEYATLEYTDINGDPSSMDFEHPVVKPSGRPYKLIINKAIQEGNEVPEGVTFDFLIKIKGVPYEGKVVTSDGEITISDGKISLKANETAYIYVEGNKDGTLIPYEVTELQHVNDGVISELVNVTVVQGNGTRVDNVVSGTIGNNESTTITKRYYYYTTTTSGNTKTYTWYSSNDGIKDWVYTGITEKTTASTPSIPDIFGNDYNVSTKYYDSDNVLAEETSDLTLDFIEGENIKKGTTIKVKNRSEGIVFYYNAQNDKENYYNNGDHYSYQNAGHVPLASILENYGTGYEKVGYKETGTENKSKYRTVYFYNKVEEKKVYEVTTKAVTQPKTSITELTFTNSYMLVYGKITVNKSINDYYSVHGNPTFLYRLDKMDDNQVAQSYYDYIEFKLDESEYDSLYVMDGDEINSKSSNIATSILFEDLTPGTYVLTELQPIRYEIGDVVVNSGDSSIDKGRATIVIKSTNKEVELTYVNEKVNNENFSHTDIVRNTFTIAPKENNN